MLEQRNLMAQSYDVTRAQQALCLIRERFAPELRTLAGDLEQRPCRRELILPQQWKQFPPIRWLKLYGSRALGRQRPGSAIDLAFSSEEDCSPELAAAFEELPTPYRMDVSHWESLRHEGLRQHIARFGVLVQVLSVSK